MTGHPGRSKERIVLAVSAEQVKRAVLSVLEHDRWNSNLTDDHIAEKVAATLEQDAAASGGD